MAMIDANIIQTLLDRIRKIKETIETAGDVSRTKLKEIKVDEVIEALPRDPNDQFNAAAWSNLSEIQQNECTKG